MEFMTLESYVTWRNEKRAIYKNLSEEIRSLKNEIREAMKTGVYAGNKQSSLIRLKYDATAIMEERKAAKVMARDSWNKWKASEPQKAAA